MPHTITIGIVSHQVFSATKMYTVSPYVSLFICLINILAFIFANSEF